MINKSLCYVQKQCHLIVWKVEKIQKIHIQKLQGLRMAEHYFFQKVQCVKVIKSKFLKEQVARGLLSNLAGTKQQILKYVFLV